MTREERRTLIEDSARNVLELVKMHDQFERAVRSSSPGIKAATYDGVGGRPSGHSDPTPGLGRDEVLQLERRLEKMMRDIHHDTRLLVTQVREVVYGDDPRCEFTGEAVFRSSDVGGRLTRTRNLGRWAYDFVVREGRLPTEKEVKARRRVRNRK